MGWRQLAQRLDDAMIAKLGSSNHGLLLLAVCVVLSASTALAEHAVISLDVIGPDGQTKGAEDQEPPLGGVNPRARMTVKAGDPLVLQFILTNIYPHGVVKDVTVRYFVVRSDKIGRKTVPLLEATETEVTEAEIRKRVIVQGKVVMNFKPKCRVGARLRFRISKSGIYLVRVDTLNTKSDHEHFAAIDLVVK